MMNRRFGVVWSIYQAHRTFVEIRRLSIFFSVLLSSLQLFFWRFSVIFISFCQRQSLVSFISLNEYCFAGKNCVTRGDAATQQHLQATFVCLHTVSPQASKKALLSNHPLAFDIITIIINIIIVVNITISFVLHLTNNIAGFVDVSDVVISRWSGTRWRRRGVLFHFLIVALLCVVLEVKQLPCNASQIITWRETSRWETNGKEMWLRSLSCFVASHHVIHQAHEN